MNNNISTKNTQLPLGKSLKDKSIIIQQDPPSKALQEPIIIPDSDDEEVYAPKKLITENNVINVSSTPPISGKTLVKQVQPKSEEVAFYEGHGLQRLYELEVKFQGMCKSFKNQDTLKKLRSTLTSIKTAKDNLTQREINKQAIRYINTIDLLFTGVKSISVEDSQEEKCDLMMPEPVNNLHYLLNLIKMINIEGPGCELKATEPAKGVQFGIEDVLRYFYV